MSKYEIEVPGLPEGWKPVAYRVPVKGDNIINFFGDLQTAAGSCGHPRLIVKKKQLRRIVLEETGEVRKALKGDYIERIGEPGVGYWGHKEESNETYKIWRGVKETAPPLHNADDNESLRLSVDECKLIYQAMRKYHVCIDALVLHKLCDFLRKTNDSTMG